MYLKQIIKIFTIVFCTNILIFSFAKADIIKEINQPFGQWLVSCKENMLTAKNDCFIGSPFENEYGRGAIVFTKYYLAIAHNELNLSQGVNLQVDEADEVDSFMNNGINVFFKNIDRKSLLQQMNKGENLTINIKGITTLAKSLAGFSDAYNFYIKQTN